MKKTYNVCSKSHGLKFLSVMFFFTLFFFGMSSSATAQLATSRAAAGSAVEADYSITMKAQIGVTVEVAVEILESEFQDIRKDLTKDLAPMEEAGVSAHHRFLSVALEAINFKNVAVKDALIMAHMETAKQVANYNTQAQNIVSADAIAREYVERLK
ncbi:MAG: hypothetical protein ACO3MG_06105 [Saprospiraceae bacterium]